jgi:putative transposase
MIVSATQQSQEDKPMANDTPKLTDQEVLQRARTLLAEHLPLQADGYTCTTDDLLDVLLGVAANRGTVEAVCADLVGTPDAETIRGYFKEQLRVEDLPELERRLNAALSDEIPPRVWRQARDVAIDFHDRPYYGKQSQATGLWVRGRARDGTTRFYRVITAYVMLNHLRVTLVVRFVLPDEDTVDVLKDVLKRAKRLGIQIARLFLDKGFASIAVQEYLTHSGQPALIACPIRGKTGGTRALCQGHKSYLTAYTFTSGHTAWTAQLAVCRAFTTARRTKRMKRRATWLIYILIHLDLSPRQTRRLYRRRFGVESSYRCAGQVRGWTTSPNPAYRFVLLALSFVLLNVWVHLRWLFTQVPRRGPRGLDVRRFRLTRFAQFIQRALERLYGCVDQIVALAVPLT